MTKPKCLLLDRDGVLNVDLPKSVRSVAQMELLPFVANAVGLLCKKGYTLLVVTNQACVARGDLTVNELDRIHVEMERQFALEGGRIGGWFCCIHSDSDECDCRKPKTGLFLQAQQKFNFVMNETWMIGDAERDILAAITAGCKPALVQTGKGLETQNKIPFPVPTFSNLLEFAKQLDI